MRRTFPCGHAGKGKYCHRCDGQTKVDPKAASHELPRSDRRERLRKIIAEASIDLAPVAHLPAVCERAANVLTQLAAGVHPFDLKGQSIGTTDHRLISIPIELHYCLLVERESRRPLRILSHGTYDGVIMGGSAFARAYL
jgi:hypothetical protein